MLISDNKMYFGRSTLVECDCPGIACPGMYHWKGESGHEYNPGKPKQIATAQYSVDRKPLASFYHHIDGKYVVLAYKGTSKEERFYYSQHGGRKGALVAAADRVAGNRQAQLFDFDFAPLPD